MKTKLGYKGVCHVDVFEDDKLVKTIDVNNTLTNGGQYCMLTALSDKPQHRLVKAILGTGETISPAINNTVSDVQDPYSKFVQFTTPTLTEPLGTIDLKVTWKLEVSEYNGLTISEIGLLYKDAALEEHLFCRVTLSGIDQIFKTANTALNGVWTITVTES